MKSYFRWLLVSLVIAVLTACGGGGSGSKVVSENAGVLDNTINIPPEVDTNDDRKTLEGIDTNNNGIRDVIELAVYKTINSSENNTSIAVSDYKKLLEMIKEVQPKASSQVESINEHKFYCEYTTLSSETREILPYDVLLEMVHDTSERRKKYRQSLKPITTSRGAEKCD